MVSVCNATNSVMYNHVSTLITERLADNSIAEKLNSTWCRYTDVKSACPQRDELSQENKS